MNRPSRSRSPRASRSLRARIALFSVGEERQLQLGYVRIMYIYIRARRYAYTQEGTRTASLLMTSFWNFEREREREMAPSSEMREELFRIRGGYRRHDIEKSSALWDSGAAELLLCTVDSLVPVNIVLSWK